MSKNLPLSIIGSNYLRPIEYIENEDQHKLKLIHLIWEK